jgi:beta-1,4-mannosyltransferase
MLIDAMGAVEGVTLVVTGSGRRRREYEARLAALPIAVATGWLEEEEYERLLQAADAGLSLHRSASGLDFPMKIVDFLGAGLPVIAYDYGEALRVPLEESGAALFTTATELAAIIRDRSFRPPPKSRQLWDSWWSERAEPLVRSVART